MLIRQALDAHASDLMLAGISNWISVNRPEVYQQNFSGTLQDSTRVDGSERIYGGQPPLRKRVFREELEIFMAKMTK